MKKVKIYNYIKLVLIILHLLTLIIQGVYNIIPLSFTRFCFPYFLLFVSLSLFAKFTVFKNESVLWFACVLFMMSFAIFLTYFSKLTFKNSWPVFFLVPALCSLITGLAFKDFLQLSLFSFFFSLGFPLFLLTYDILSGWKFMVVLIISLLLGIFVVNVLVSKLRVNRKKNNGEI